jgi:hypothetical protein
VTFSPALAPRFTLILQLQSRPNTPRQGAFRRRWPPLSLAKDCNAALAYLDGSSLRARSCRSVYTGANNPAGNCRPSKHQRPKLRLRLMPQQLSSRRVYQAHPTAEKQTCSPPFCRVSAAAHSGSGSIFSRHFSPPGLLVCSKPRWTR